MRRSTAICIGLLCNAVWGLAFVVPYVLPGVHPLVVTIGRYLVFGLTALAMALTMPGLNLRQLNLAEWAAAARLGFTGHLGCYLLLVIAIQLAGVALPTLIIGTLPVSIALTGNWLTRGFPFRRLLPSVLLIGAGLLLLNGERLMGARLSPAFWVAFGAAGLALILWTWFAIDNDRFMAAHPSITPIAWAVATGLACGVEALALVPPFLVWNTLTGGKMLAPLADPDLLVRTLLGLLLLGAVVSAFAAILWNIAAKVLPVALTGQLVVVETLSSLIYAFIADERLPSLLETASATLIIAGVIRAVHATAAKAVQGNAAG